MNKISICDKELHEKFWSQIQAGIIEAGIIGTYRGYKVFEDSTKKYGEVELR